jgi:dGTPase
MLWREDLEKLEKERLAPYAQFSAGTRGRSQEERLDSLRMEFQRDRDRIIHCSAFRKLEGKTQVFLPFEGDYHRNRLTHTMEVAQIARTMARTLRLNEDLTEAVALAHDLGHAPFGHAGENALRKKMADYGGFEHNEQGVRVVERLEERFVGRPGLNLTWEVREGVAKHHTAFDHPSLGRFDPEKRPPLEAQICDVADEIAYLHHDLDDALKFELIHEDDLPDVPWVGEIWQEARGGYDSRRDRAQLKFRALGKLFDIAVQDVLKQTTSNVERLQPETIDDVRVAGEAIVACSSEMTERYAQLRTFLMERVYMHPRVVRNAIKAERFIGDLFDLYERVPGQLSRRHQQRIDSEGLRRVVCDYIAGMTDRFCQEEYSNAFGAQLA